MAYNALPLTSFQTASGSNPIAGALAKLQLPNYKQAFADKNWFITNFQNQIKYAAQAYCVTFGQLMDSFENEEFNQFDVDARRVSAILKNPDGTGLLGSMQLFRDIEVGYQQAEFDELGSDARLVITGGRHRLSAILTMFEHAATPIPYEVVRELKVRVNAKLYASVTDLMRAVFVDNSSRSMGSGEKANVKLQLTQSVSDPKDWVELVTVCANANTAADAKRAFALAFLNITEQEEFNTRQLQKQTRFLIGNKIATDLWGDEAAFKGQNSKKSCLDPDKVSTIVQQAAEIYELHIPQGATNVAAVFGAIGDAVAAELIEANFEAEEETQKVTAKVPAPKDEPFIDVTPKRQPLEVVGGGVKRIAVVRKSL